jgi:Zn finger protein HypA/HybF involved in hydrogenase expression
MIDEAKNARMTARQMTPDFNSPQVTYCCWDCEHIFVRDARNALELVCPACESTDEFVVLD